MPRSLLVIGWFFICVHSYPTSTVCIDTASHELDRDYKIDEEKLQQAKNKHTMYFLNALEREIGRNITSLHNIDSIRKDVEKLVEIDSQIKKKIEEINTKGRHPAAKTPDIRTEFTTGKRGGPCVSRGKRRCADGRFSLQLNLPQGSYPSDYEIEECNLKMTFMADKSARSSKPIIPNILLTISDRDNEKESYTKQIKTDNYEQTTNEQIYEIKNHFTYTLKKFIEKHPRVSRIQISIFKRNNAPLNGFVAETKYKIMPELNRNKRSGGSITPDGYHGCGLRKVKINFKELPGWTHIQSPKDYHLTYCAGECTSSGSVNGSILRERDRQDELAHKFHSCCVPAGTEVMEILYTSSKSVHVMKTIDGMRVTNCRCT